MHVHFNTVITSTITVLSFAVWSPLASEQLMTAQEPHNPEDKYAVSVIKNDTTVGQLSKTCWHFLQRDGEILCTVTGSSQRSNLMEGGLEIPCIYTFRG